MQNTADYILETVAPIFNQKGYTGTSLSDITKATKLTKGAVYCNFENKEEIAIKCFKLNVLKTITPLFRLLNAKSNSIQKLLVVTQFYRDNYALTRQRGGCPILNVGVDAQHNNPALFKTAKRESRKMIAYLTRLIQHGIINKEIKADVDASKTAKNIHTMIEGGLFMSLTQNKKDYLMNILDHIENSIINNIRK